MMWDHGYMWNMGWGWHWIPMALWWGFLVLMAVGMARWIFSGWGGGSGNALNIAKARYASGEITKKEFERLKSDLQ